jgi:hypothetical protein
MKSSVAKKIMGEAMKINIAAMATNPAKVFSPFRNLRFVK